MLETTAVLAGQTGRALAALVRPAPTPLARSRLAYQQAVLERYAGRAERAASLLAEARHAFESSGAQAATPIERMELRQFEALLAAEAGEAAEAIALQAQNVEAFPVENDLITGGPALWLLADLQIRADELEQAGETLERLQSRMALGSVPFGGFFLLSHWPGYEEARRDPGFAAALARLRPAYADLWKADSWRNPNDASPSPP